MRELVYENTIVNSKGKAISNPITLATKKLAEDHKTIADEYLKNGEYIEIVPTLVELAETRQGLGLAEKCKGKLDNQPDAPYWNMKYEARKKMVGHY